MDDWVTDRRGHCIFHAVKKKIIAHRKQIDTLDSRILELIQERVRETGLILQAKAAAGEPTDTREREEEIFNRLIEESSGTIQADSSLGIWPVMIPMGMAEFLRRQVESY